MKYHIVVPFITNYHNFKNIQSASANSEHIYLETIGITLYPIFFFQIALGVPVNLDRINSAVNTRQRANSAPLPRYLSVVHVVLLINFDNNDLLKSLPSVCLIWLAMRHTEFRLKCPVWNRAMKLACRVEVMCGMLLLFCFF